ncbi:hypothetical protein POVWA2_009210 [Plasmodium ovale wallikeri]|uniref:Uncharacterized protein n=1 Tax=Plasmodium ovale wallikeri TaxID=864142 RepID=A0A1A8YLH4_PLAOA|nr:hypothetical protein POVWA2_009210 [Plasmodium ovale wallikeri]
MHYPSPRPPCPPNTQTHVYIYIFIHTYTHTHRLPPVGAYRFCRSPVRQFFPFCLLFPCFPTFPLFIFYELKTKEEVSCIIGVTYYDIEQTHNVIRRQKRKEKKKKKNFFCD